MVPGLQVAIDALHKKNEEVAQAKENVLEAARHYIEQESIREERFKRASELYWHCDEVSTAMICEIFYIKSIKKKGFESIVQHAAPAYTKVCRQCQAESTVYASSHRNKQELEHDSYHYLCQKCSPKPIIYHE